MLMLNYDWIFIVSNYNDHSDHSKDPIFIIIVFFSYSFLFPFPFPFLFLCLVNLLLHYIQGTEEKSTFRIKKWRWVHWFSSFQLLLLQSFWAGPRLLSRQMVKFGSFFAVFSFERKVPSLGWFSCFYVLSGMALLEFRSTLNDSKNYLSNWNDSDDTPCKWIGITCNPQDQSVLAMYVTSN